MCKFIYILLEPCLSPCKMSLQSQTSLGPYLDTLACIKLLSCVYVCITSSNPMSLFVYNTMSYHTQTSPGLKRI